MKILVIDDEAIVRRALERAFQRAGHIVTSAENGVRGLKLWTEVQPDIVMLDILMPGLSGLQVLKEIGEKKRGKVVLMSANASVLGETSPEQLGADLFVAKPFEDIIKVVQVVEELGQ